MDFSKPGINLQGGFAVSAKKFGRAVDRNVVKRLMRECYRLQKNNLENQLKLNNKSLSIFIIYTGTELPIYSQLFDKMKIVISRLINLSNESDHKNT